MVIRDFFGMGLFFTDSYGFIIKSVDTWFVKCKKTRLDSVLLWFINLDCLNFFVYDDHFLLIFVFLFNYHKIY